jgi:hypothetical protein
MPAGHHGRMAGEQFTLHRRLWGAYRRLPRLVRVWIVVVAVGAIVKLLLLSGSGDTSSVSAAVTSAVREATGPTPALACSALSPAGLSQFLSQFGSGEGASAAGDQLVACNQLVLQLRSQATPQQLADFARGSVRTVQLRGDGSALVVFVAADHRLGAELTLTRHAGRWLIDTVAGGAIAGAQ